MPVDPHFNSNDPAEADIKDFFDKLLKHRQTIFSMMVFCLALSLIYSFTARPIYKSVSRIMVDAAPPKIVKVENTVLPDYTDRANSFNSQIEILKSRTVAELVMQEIGGYELWSERNKPVASQKVITQDERITALLKHVKVSPVRATMVIEIAVEDYSPELAAKIANTWTKAYILFSSIDQFVQRKSELETDLAQQLKYLKEKHPIIIALRSEIESIDIKMRNERDRVMNDQNSAKANYTSITNVKVLDRAQVPLQPDKPRKLLNMVLSLLVGLLGGVFMALLFESLDQTVKSSDNISQLFGLTNLAMIPHIKSGSGSPEVGPELLSAKVRHSMLAEAFRGLRTSIIFSEPDLLKKTMVITSIVPSEGKTTVAINLATVFAQSESKVLLVDADLRNPRVHTVFNMERGSGVSDVLVYDKQDLASYIHKTEVPNLDVMTCGAIPPNPSELLGSKKMADLIAKLSGMYDKVIFDAPPILAATDSVILATKVDATVLVAKSGSTKRQEAVRAIGILKSVPSHILGVVLNMVDTAEPGGYHYYGYATKEEHNKLPVQNSGKEHGSAG